MSEQENRTAIATLHRKAISNRLTDELLTHYNMNDCLRMTKDMMETLIHVIISNPSTTDAQLKAMFVTLSDIELKVQDALVAGRTV